MTRQPATIPLRVLTRHTATSTNLLIRRENAPGNTPTLLLAHEQTHGRGQRGNQWISLPGDLTFSISIPNLSIPARSAFRIAQASAIACALWLRESGVPALVKWPNDIIAQERKIGGILIENQCAGSQITAAIIGIGINLAPRPEPNPQFHYPATSLADITQTPIPSPLTAAKRIAWRAIYALTHPHFPSIPFLYHKLLFLRGIHALYADANGTFRARITHTLPDGTLCLTDTQGKNRRYAFKEIETRFPTP